MSAGAPPIPAPPIPAPPNAPGPPPIMACIIAGSMPANGFYPAGPPIPAAPAPGAPGIAPGAPGMAPGPPIPPIPPGGPYIPCIIYIAYCIAYGFIICLIISGSLSIALSCGFCSVICLSIGLL